jgi:mannose-6-phosphate isomerase-like protein (cupin superfamily)
MVGEHLEAQSRRVVSGLDASGKSTVVSDENTKIRVATPGFTAMDIWGVDALPTPVDADNALGEAVALEPVTGGFVYRITTFPPDSEWDPEAGYKEALEAMQGGDTHADDNDSGIAGLHATDTVDVVTILSGEMYAVLETTEVCLGVGDTFIQRGTLHTWSNRGTTPATVIALQMSAKR